MCLIKRELGEICHVLQQTDRSGLVKQKYSVYPASSEKKLSTGIGTAHRGNFII